MKKIRLLIAAAFTVSASISFSQTANYGSTSIQGNQNASVFSIFGNSSSSNGSGIELQGNGSSGAGNINFISGNTSYWRAFTFNRYNGTSWPSLFTITKDGRVGIGNFVYDGDLNSKLQIGVDYTMINLGDITASPFNGSSYLGFNASRQPDNYIASRSNGTNNGGAMIFATVEGGLNFVTIKSGLNNGGSGSQWASPAQIMSNIKMAINPDGRVSMGDPTNGNGGLDVYGNANYGYNIHSKSSNIIQPTKLFVGSNSTGVVYSVTSTGAAYFKDYIQIGTSCVDLNYKLLVEGAVRCRKLRVDQNSWCDYVFAKNYKLKSLEDVESYIKENNHLPDVPSEQEVKEKGVDISEMNAILLKKIEELYLYSIEQDKKIKELQIQVSNLTK